MTRHNLCISPPKRHRFKPATVLIPSNVAWNLTPGHKDAVGLLGSKGRLGREVHRLQQAVAKTLIFVAEGSRAKRVFASELGSLPLKK